MKSKTGSMITRKLIASFVAATITAIYFTFGTLENYNPQTVEPLGESFNSWFSLFLIYAGGIILLYGSAVSVGIEYIQRKWLKLNNWLYILLHGLFGLVNGVWFASWLMALHGMAAALLYAFMDRWLYKRMAEKKGIKEFVLVPLLLCVISWGVMFFISPPSPPFTKEEAVKFATSGNGTVTDAFPKKAGKWQGTVNGYEVQRETSVQKAGQKIYLVIFTEKWRKGQETGSWLLSYQVDKGSCTAYAEEGERPPYYK